MFLRKRSNFHAFFEGVRELLIIGAIFYTAPSFAYIDPGTGSALFYVVSGIVVSLYFAIRGLYYRFCEYVFRFGKKDQNCEIAIHCEDPRYETTFLPIVEYLSGKGVEVTIFTMYRSADSFR